LVPSSPQLRIVYWGTAVPRPSETCKFYLFDKITKTHFAKSYERASDLLELVHSNVCNPMNTTSVCGHEYFITFTDDFIRYVYAYLMKHNPEAFNFF
jgi:hypothetical protein